LGFCIVFYLNFLCELLREDRLIEVLAPLKHSFVLTENYKI